MEGYVSAAATTLDELAEGDWERLATIQLTTPQWTRLLVLLVERHPDTEINETLWRFEGRQRPWPSAILANYTLPEAVTVALLRLALVYPETRLLSHVIDVPLTPSASWGALGSLVHAQTDVGSILTHIARGLKGSPIPGTLPPIHFAVVTHLEEMEQGRWMLRDLTKASPLLSAAQLSGRASSSASTPMVWYGARNSNEFIAKADQSTYIAAAFVKARQSGVYENPDRPPERRLDPTFRLGYQPMGWMLFAKQDDRFVITGFAGVDSEVFRRGVLARLQQIRARDADPWDTPMLDTLAPDLVAELVRAGELAAVLNLAPMFSVDASEDMFTRHVTFFNLLKSHGFRDDDARFELAVSSEAFNSARELLAGRKPVLPANQPENRATAAFPLVKRSFNSFLTAAASTRPYLDAVPYPVKQAQHNQVYVGHLSTRSLLNKSSGTQTVKSIFSEPVGALTKSFAPLILELRYGTGQPQRFGDRVIAYVGGDEDRAVFALIKRTLRSVGVVYFNNVRLIKNPQEIIAQLGCDWVVFNQGDDASDAAPLPTSLVYLFAPESQVLSRFPVAERGWYLSAHLHPRKVAALRNLVSSEPPPPRPDTTPASDLAEDSETGGISDIEPPSDADLSSAPSSPDRSPPQVQVGSDADSLIEVCILPEHGVAFMRQRRQGARPGEPATKCTHIAPLVKGPVTMESAETRPTLTSPPTDNWVLLEDATQTRNFDWQDHEVVYRMLSGSEQIFWRGTPDDDALLRKFKATTAIVAQDRVLPLFGVPPVTKESTLTDENPYGIDLDTAGTYVPNDPPQESLAIPDTPPTATPPAATPLPATPDALPDRPDSPDPRPRTKPRLDDDFKLAVLSDAQIAEILSVANFNVPGFATAFVMVDIVFQVASAILSQPAMRTLEFFPSLVKICRRHLSHARRENPIQTPGDFEVDTGPVLQLTERNAHTIGVLLADLCVMVDVATHPGNEENATSAVRECFARIRRAGRKKAFSYRSMAEVFGRIMFRVGTPITFTLANDGTIGPERTYLDGFERALTLPTPPIFISATLYRALFANVNETQIPTPASSGGQDLSQYFYGLAKVILPAMLPGSTADTWNTRVIAGMPAPTQQMGSTRPVFPSYVKALASLNEITDLTHSIGNKLFDYVLRGFEGEEDPDWLQEGFLRTLNMLEEHGYCLVVPPWPTKDIGNALLAKHHTQGWPWLLPYRYYYPPITEEKRAGLAQLAAVFASERASPAFRELASRYIT